MLPFTQAHANLSELADPAGAVAEMAVTRNGEGSVALLDATRLGRHRPFHQHRATAAEASCRKIAWARMPASVPRWPEPTNQLEDDITCDIRPRPTAWFA
ncbi:hypothetical protein [Rubrivivax gelatinosus]|nr:hypothetical protein [Rubrivivax gelatinosus]